MTPLLTGTPAVMIGSSLLICEGSELSVPPVCDECRQLRRWLPRTLAWGKAGAARFKAIVTAILAEHDDILTSLCGFCMVADAPDCSCFVAQYKMIGLPLSVPIWPQVEGCVPDTQQLDIPVLCYVSCPIDCPIDCVVIVAPDLDLPTCWIVETTPDCQTCLKLLLDPCNVPEHLQAMTIAYKVASTAFVRPYGAAGLLAVLTDLFVGSVPQIVRAQFGEIIVTLGRPMTAFERRYLPFFQTLIPLGLGVELFFATACPPE